MRNWLYSGIKRSENYRIKNRMKFSLDSLVHRGFSVYAPATPAEIAEAEKSFNFSFPADYKEFVSLTNGLEGQTDQAYLVLWSVKELAELNSAYQVREFVRNIILFGSDGAEEAFGFDTSGMPTSPASIVKLPFVGMGYITQERLAGSFEEFLSIKMPAK